MALNSSEIDELISALLENKEFNFPSEVLKETTEANPVQVKNMLSIFHSLSIIHEVIDYLHDDWEDLRGIYEGYILHFEESRTILMKSFQMSLHGSYNIAFTTLRNALDSLINGVLYNYMVYLLCNKETKMNIEDTLTEYMSQFNNMITKVRRSNLYDRVSADSTFFFNIIEHKSKDCRECGLVGVPWFPKKVTFQDSIEQFSKWGLLEPFKNHQRFREYVDYGGLSQNVHEQTWKSDLAKRAWAYDEFTLEPKLVPEAFTEYSKRFLKTVDAMLVLSLNMLYPLIINSNKLKEKVEKFSSDVSFKESQLNNTNILLTEKMLDGN